MVCWAWGYMSSDILAAMDRDIEDGTDIFFLSFEGHMTVTRLVSSQPSAIDVSDSRIFVGNVSTDSPFECLLSIFFEYGEIEKGPLGFDKKMRAVLQNHSIQMGF
ncbi:hypothetical protein SUGI_0478220 [Cryptomeria japonica]|nr:hypothetical protein SUGI_0478220 [Cryptomeria japonica]